MSADSDDVLSTLCTSLEARAKSLRGRPGMAAIFLLNNLSQVRREILASSLGDLLGRAGEDGLGQRLRGLKIAYLEIWSPLVSALLDQGLDNSGAAGAIRAVTGGADKRETKDRFVRFADAFDDVQALHRAAPWDLAADLELKEKLRDEVEKMIVPTYTKFVAKHAAGDFSKSASYQVLSGPVSKSCR